MEFAKLGSEVVGWDISRTGLEDTEQKLNELGLSKHWHSYSCDITDRQQVYETAEKVNCFLIVVYCNVTCFYSKKWQ